MAPGSFNKQRKARSAYVQRHPASAAFPSCFLEPGQRTQKSMIESKTGLRFAGENDPVNLILPFTAHRLSERDGDPGVERNSPLKK
jgi:hypothetical protein